MLASTGNPPPAHIGRFGRRVILPVAAFVAGAMSLVSAFVLITSERQDAIALDASTRLAKTALAVKEREIGGNMKDYAGWDDAYKNLHLQLDLKWASTDGNIGANIYDSLGYELVFVVSADGRTVYSVLDGNPQDADAFALIPNGLITLVRQARQADDDKPAVGLLRSGADIALVAAAAILPPPGSAEPPPPAARSVLIFGKRLGGEFLERMGTDYLLAEIALLGPGEITASASLPLLAPDGERLGQLAWKPDRPGQELLRVLLPPLSVALLGLAAFAWLVLRNARRSAADFTAEVVAHSRDKHLALHDALTELPNRVMLRERLEMALAGMRRHQSHVAVMCLDLDQFKEVNDTLGHGVGDLLLREAAHRMRSSVRETDTVARLGGDEFALVQVSSNQPADARALCRRLVIQLAAPFKIDCHELYVGASIGVAIAPADGYDHERLLKNADVALYRAKQAGRGTYRFFKPEMDSELQAPSRPYRRFGQDAA